MARAAYPDLQRLVAERGGYEKITATDWKAHDAAVRAWWRDYVRGLPTRKK